MYLILHLGHTLVHRVAHSHVKVGCCNLPGYIQTGLQKSSLTYSKYNYHRSSLAKCVGVLHKLLQYNAYRSRDPPTTKPVLGCVNVSSRCSSNFSPGNRSPSPLPGSNARPFGDQAVISRSVSPWASKKSDQKFVPRPHSHANACQPQASRPSAPGGENVTIYCVVKRERERGICFTHQKQTGRTYLHASRAYGRCRRVVAQTKTANAVPCSCT